MRGQQRGTWPSLPKPRGKKPWPLNYMSKLRRSRKGVTPTTTQSSSFLWNNTPSKMSRCWQTFFCSIRVTSSSYQKFGALTKLDVQMTPTTVSSTGWFTILTANASSSRIRSSIGWRWRSDIKIRTEESHCQYGDSQFRDFFKDDCPRWVNPRL